MDNNNIIHLPDRYSNHRFQIATQYPQYQQQQQVLEQQQQIPQSPPQQTPITILSILKDLKINIGDYTNSWNENGDWLLRGLVVCINQLLSINDQYPNNFSQFLPEHMKLPMITIEGYIARIIKYSPCSKECFITILMYIDKLIMNRHFIVNSYNIHRILITCVLVGAKYLDDIFYNNQFYSQVGGISVKEINNMELDLLKLLSYDVSTPIVTYETYITYFERYTKQVQMYLNQQPNIKGLPSRIPNLDTYTPESFSLVINNNHYNHHQINPFHHQQHQQLPNNSNYKKINSNNNNSTNNSNSHINLNHNTDSESDIEKLNKQNFNNNTNTNANQEVNNNQKQFIHQQPQTFRFQPQPNLVA